MKHLDISSLIKEQKLYEEFDKEHDCFILDEDKVLDYIEEEMSSEKGGMIVDYHTCDFFPERYFDFVVVLRSDNGILFQRLKKRGYEQKKITENVDAEIFQICLDEARESYKPEIVIELNNNSTKDMEENVKNLLDWITKW